MGEKVRVVIETVDGVSGVNTLGAHEALASVACTIELALSLMIRHGVPVI